MKTRTRLYLSAILVLALAAANCAQTAPHQVVLNFVPANATVKFTLGLHSIPYTGHPPSSLVRSTSTRPPEDLAGRLILTPPGVRPETMAVTKKMHREIIESGGYPEIVFCPDHAEGQLAAQGVSTLQLHGIFAIHGAEHEMTIPVRVEASPGRSTATQPLLFPISSGG